MMGWLFYTDRRVKSYADEKAEITRLCTFDTDTRKTALIKACKVGTTWYAAARGVHLDGTPVDDRTYISDADGSITFGAVFLTRYDNGCWGYKDMEESAGPVESRAPLSLLDLLSELNDPDSYAHAWRQSRSTRRATKSSWPHPSHSVMAAPVRSSPRPTIGVDGKGGGATVLPQPAAWYGCPKRLLRVLS